MNSATEIILENVFDNVDLSEFAGYERHLFLGGILYSWFLDYIEIEGLDLSYDFICSINFEAIADVVRERLHEENKTIIF